MKYLSIILLILICSCNNANQKTQSIPIDTTENDNEDEVYTPSIHKDHVNIDSIINNSGYKMVGSLGCVLWDSIEFSGIGIGPSPFHIPTAKLPKVHINSKGIIDTISGLNDGNVGPFLYLPTTEETVDAIRDHGYGTRMGKGVVYDTTKKGIVLDNGIGEQFYWSHGSTSKVIRVDIDSLEDNVTHGYHVYTLKAGVKWLWKAPNISDSSFNKD